MVREETDLQTQRSDEPVSKSRLRVTPGVPILTGTTYSRLETGTAVSTGSQGRHRCVYALTLIRNRFRANTSA